MPISRPDAWRQSSIARFDACPLSLRFDLEIPLRQMPRTMGTLGARGILAHRAFAAALNHMREHGERRVPVEIAMELLTEIIAQRDVPDDDVVHLPISELRWLRVLVTRWAYQHEFSVDRIVDVEERLYGEIEVVGPNGTRYLRRVTGQPDVLIAGPGEDEATIVDWKTGWSPPSRRREPSPENPEPEDKLSDMGYVQQVVYGWLVMKNYPAINRVTEREYYVMANEDPVREASVERWEMERVEDILAAVVSQMDAAIDGGSGSARWFPIPGTHCAMCVGRRFCPIRVTFGIPETLEDAQRLAREWLVAGEIRKERTPYLKDWIDANGPVPIAHAKGRREVGFNQGNSLSLYEPSAPPESEYDVGLIEVARERGALVE